MLTPKWRLLSKQDQGFTLFEVVVASFVALLFFLLVIQASTLTIVSKAQAQEASEVLSWLQKDIESVKYEASILQVATLKAAISGSNRVYLSEFNDEKRFKTGDIIEFITTQPDGKKYTIFSANSPTTGYFRLIANLQTTYPPGSIVIVRSRKQASITTTIPLGSSLVYLTDTSQVDVGSQLMFGGLSSSSNSLIPETPQGIYDVQSVSLGAINLTQKLKVSLNTANSVNTVRCNPPRKDLGYADELRDQLMGSDLATPSSSLTLDSSLTKTSKGKQYTVRRIMDIADIPPYSMLQISYTTTPKLPNAVSLDNFVARVMPDIIFYCN